MWQHCEFLPRVTVGLAGPPLRYNSACLTQLSSGDCFKSVIRRTPYTEVVAEKVSSERVFVAQPLFIPSSYEGLAVRFLQRLTKAHSQE